MFIINVLLSMTDCAKAIGTRIAKNSANFNILKGGPLVLDSIHFSRPINVVWKSVIKISLV